MSNEQHAPGVAVQSDFRTKCLPASPSAVDTDEYQLVPIKSEASEFAEQLVDLATYGIATEGFFAREDGLNAPLYARFNSASRSIYARRGVALKLQKVNEHLRTYGVEVFVLDGFRPISVQAELWNWFLKEAESLFPKATDEERERFALRFCSNPARFDAANASTWPTHATGGAVDLCLKQLGSDRLLHMGGIYLDPSEVSTTRYFEQQLRRECRSDDEARRNRRLLFWAMYEEGFVNYPYEWWHFDYLTQAWVMNQGFPSGVQAHYGLANLGQPVQGTILK